MFLLVTALPFSQRMTQWATGLPRIPYRKFHMLVCYHFVNFFTLCPSNLHIAFPYISTLPFLTSTSHIFVLGDYLSHQ